MFNSYFDITRGYPQNIQLCRYIYPQNMVRIWVIVMLHPSMGIDANTTIAVGGGPSVARLENR